MAHLITGIPYTAIQFFFYEYFKQRLSKGETSLGVRMQSGAMAGIIAGFVTYPFDLTRTVLSTNTGHKHESVLGVMKRVFQN